jgi:hypothetical protein
VATLAFLFVKDMVKFGARVSTEFDMAKKTGEHAHRGRLQAQGGGTQEDEAWAQDSPPTRTEILNKCDLLEAKLSEKEKALRETAFAQLREFINAAAKKGGLNAGTGVFKKSFPKRPLGDIRVDLDVFKGSACVPDPLPADNEN